VKLYLFDATKDSRARVLEKQGAGRDVLHSLILFRALLQNPILGATAGIGNGDMPNEA